MVMSRYSPRLLVRHSRIPDFSDSVHATALVHVRTQGGALPLRELPWCSPGFDTHTPCRLTKHINNTRVPRALLFAEERANARGPARLGDVVRII